MYKVAVRTNSSFGEFGPFQQRDTAEEFVLQLASRSDVQEAVIAPANPPPAKRPKRAKHS